MTVTKGKRTYAFPVNSGSNSDVESLHLGSAQTSDTESLNNEPLSRSRNLAPPVVKNIKHEELIILKKNSGRKKLRRYQNRCLLQTLAEEDENEDTVVIMDFYESPFTKLLQDEDALHFWNAFIDKSEEEQAQLIAAFSQNKKPEKTDKVQKEKPFARISSKIKHTIKVKKNLSLEQVKKSEDDLIAFFKITPNLVYVQYPPTYFERLLLHAIAQYHRLQSLGVVENGTKKVEVFNDSDSWTPADCFLTDFVAQLRK